MAKLPWFGDGENNLHCGYNMSKLEMDQASLSAASEDGTLFSIYQRHKECHECLYNKIEFTENVPFIIENIPQYTYRIYKGRDPSNTVPFEPNSDFLCEVDQNFGDFGEFGIYKLQVNKDNCHMNVIKEPVNATLPILTVFLLYCIIFLAILVITYLWKRSPTELHKDESNSKKNDKPRFQALDTARGVTILCIIFGTYGAGGYKQLDHTVWNGMNFGDLLFPWLLWIMGACIPFSMTSRNTKQRDTKKMFMKSAMRSLKLFSMGLFLGLSQNTENFRVFGVLQRFGLSFLVVTVIYLFLVDRNIPNDEEVTTFLDVAKLCRGWFVVLMIVIIHTLISLIVAEPGCPRGYLGPGGWHKNGKYLGCTGGAAGYIDRLFLGDYLYQNPTIKHVYHSQNFDPEGILGTLTAIAQVFLGVQAGTIFIMYKSHFSRVVRWLSWAVITGLLGGIMCGFSKDDGLIPINKNLWSLSFVLVTSSYAFVFLSVCYVLIDVKNWWSGKPFLYAGMNAFILYVGQFLTFHQFPMKWRMYYDGYHPTHFMVLFENTWVVGFWILLSYYLYKIEFFFNI